MAENKFEKPPDAEKSLDQAAFDEWNKRVKKIEDNYEASFEMAASKEGECIWKNFGEKPSVFALLSFLPKVAEKSEEGAKKGFEMGFSERVEGSGTARILAYLQERKHPVSGARTPWKDEKSLDNLIEQIKQNPDLRVVGISAFTFEVPWACEVADKIRAEFPEISIVLGGPHADTAYTTSGRFQKAYDTKPPKNVSDDTELRRLLKHFDYVAMGSGEIALDKLLKGKIGKLPVLRGGTPEDYRKEDTKNALNRYINPARLLEGTESGFYPLPEDYTGVACYSGTEGCPNNCKFCTSALTCERLYVDRKESIPGLVKAIKESKENLIWFDNEITLLPWLNRFSKEMDKQKVTGKHWSFMGSISTFSGKSPEELAKIFELIKKSGCNQVCYGVESIDPKVLEDLHKPGLNKDRDAVLKATNEAGMIPRALMFFGGEKETEQSLSAFIEWAKICPALTFRIAYATPFQGTPLWHEANEKNMWISEELQNNVEHHTTSEPILKCPAITKDGTVTGEVDEEKLRRFQDFKISALQEIYSSEEYHDKIKNYVSVHPDQAVMVRGLIYLFERQGLVPQGSFDSDFEQVL